MRGRHPRIDEGIGAGRRDGIGAEGRKRDVPDEAGGEAARLTRDSLARHLDPEGLRQLRQDQLPISTRFGATIGAARGLAPSSIEHGPDAGGWASGQVRRRPSVGTPHPSPVGARARTGQGWMAQGWPHLSRDAGSPEREVAEGSHLRRHPW